MMQLEAVLARNSFRYRHPNPMNYTYGQQLQPEGGKNRGKIDGNTPTAQTTYLIWSHDVLHQSLGQYKFDLEGGF